MTWLESFPFSVSAFERFGFVPDRLNRFYSRLPWFGNGGVDVVFLGDSLFRGQGATLPDAAGMANQMTRLLQRVWNPTDVPGGAGFLPAQWTWSSPPTQPTTITNGDLTGTSSRVMSGSGHCVARLNAGGSAGTIALAGTDCTHVEVSHLIKTGSANTAGWAFSGGLSGTGSLTIGGAGTAEYGARTLVASGDSAAATWTLTVSEPPTDDLRLSGFVRYNGDYGTGIRGHNLACSGIQLYDPSNSNGLLRADEPTGGVNTSAIQQANIDQWSSATPGVGGAVGARRAGLFVINLLTNDQGSYGNTAETATSGAATYQAKLQTLVSAILARPSAPAILLVAPPAPSGRETYYRVFKAAMRAVAMATNHVTMLDLDAAMGEIAYSSLPASWRQADGIHYTSEAYGAMAGLIASAVITGRS
ncbi:MAG: hypothetical protein JNJ45_11600 [Chthonomonas sp.]|nr:hypothetical protein [Chthonomonas sp.]